MMLKPRYLFDPRKKSPVFRDALVAWFEENGKDYPWRRTRDPYAVLVSEIMLQQTRLGVVLGKGYFDRFMIRFPEVTVLADADESELLRVWEGLGYYRRARMLQAAARMIVDRHDGIFPKDEAALLALPGLGKYTVGALMSFAFDLPSPIVDGNVMRVLSRIFNDPTPIDSSQGIKNSWHLAGELLDQKRPRLFNSALMELGQQICKVGVPDCQSCPVAQFCKAKEPERLPVKDKKTTITEVAESVVFVINERGEILLAPEQGTRRIGLWRLPEIADDVRSDYHFLAESKYAITRYRVTLRVYRPPGVPRLRGGECWFHRDEAESLPMAAPYRKILRQLFD